MTSPTRNPKLLALIVASAMFMGALDGTIITTALPQMGRSFAVNPVELSLSITLYVLVMAVFLPVSSWVADRIGARTVFAGAIAGFTLASMLCGLSHDLWSFVGARVLQALAATLMVPVGNLVLLRSTERKDLVSVMAISTTPALIAPVLGPPLGGFLITFLSWPWVFFLNLPIGLLGVVLVLRYIPNLKSADRRPFDGFGFAVTGLALACLIYGLDRISAQVGDRRLAVGLVVLGLGLGAWAIRHARRHPFPIAPLHALRHPTFAIANLTGGALARIQFRALGFILPLMFQVGLGMSAFASGILLLGYNGGDLALKAVATQTLRVVGFRTALVASGVLTGLGAMVLVTLTPMTPFWIIFVILLVAGAVRSIMFTAVVSMSYADVPAEEIGGATVLNTMLSNITSAVGVSSAAVVLNLSGAARGEALGRLTLADFRVALVAMGVVGLAAVVFYLGLSKDAGAEVSGHGARARLIAAKAEDAASSETPL